MNPKTVITGSSFDSAMEAAVLKLAISKEKLGFKILNEGKKGLFGLGGSDWTIEVWDRSDELRPVDGTVNINRSRDGKTVELTITLPINGGKSLALVDVQERLSKRKITHVNFEKLSSLLISGGKADVATVDGCAWIESGKDGLYLTIHPPLSPDGNKVKLSDIKEKIEKTGIRDLDFKIVQREIARPSGHPILLAEIFENFQFSYEPDFTMAKAYWLGEGMPSATKLIQAAELACIREILPQEEIEAQVQAGKPSVIVAKGRLPIHGKDGYIQIFPEEVEDEKMDVEDEDKDDRSIEELLSNISEDGKIEDLKAVEDDLSFDGGSGSDAMGGDEGSDSLLMDDSFDEKSESNFDELERVDHYRIHWVQQISEGKLVAQLHPPTFGEDGVDVRGNLIPAYNGKAIVMHAGLNVRLDEEGQKAWALKTGRIRIINNNRVDVVPVFQVPGDLNMSVGSIDFSGTVEIGGSVHPGFTIKADGDIIVGKDVDAAFLQATGNVIIKGGVFGHYKGHIKAGGDVRAKFFERASVFAGNDIFSQKAVLMSRLEAGGNVVVLLNKGPIYGGAIRAGKKIEASSIGSVSNIRTEIIVKESVREEEEEKQAVERFQKAVENMKKSEELIKKISEKLKDGQDDQLTEALKKLDERMKDIRATMEENHAMLKGLRDKFRMDDMNRRIVVRKELFPNVLIGLGELLIKIPQAHGKVELGIVNNKIVNLLNPQAVAKARGGK